MKRWLRCSPVIVAKYKYRKKKGDELSFKKGEELELLEVLEGW